MSKSFWVIGTNWQGNLHFTPLTCITYRLAKGKELSLATLHFPDRSHTIIKFCKPVRICHSTFNQFLGKIFFAGMCDCVYECVNKLFCLLWTIFSSIIYCNYNERYNFLSIKVIKISNMYTLSLNFWITLRNEECCYEIMCNIKCSSWRRFFEGIDLIFFYIFNFTF